MELIGELIEALYDHEARTGKHVKKIRIHRAIWERMSDERRNLTIKTDVVEGGVLSFHGASVSLVEHEDDPSEFFRWSLIGGP